MHSRIIYRNFDKKDSSNVLVINVSGATDVKIGIIMHNLEVRNKIKLYIIEDYITGHVADRLTYEEALNYFEVRYK